MDFADTDFFQDDPEVGDDIPYTLDAFDHSHDLAFQAKARQSSPGIHRSLVGKDVQDDRPGLLSYGQGGLHSSLDREVLEGLLRRLRGLELRTLGCLSYLLGRFLQGYPSQIQEQIIAPRILPIDPEKLLHPTRPNV